MPYTIFDGHADTISVLYDKNQNLYENTCHVDLKRMEKNKHIQVFAAFIDAKNDSLAPFERCMALIRFYHNEITKNDKFIAHCNSYEDILNRLNSCKNASLLSIEGGEALSGNLENLDLYYGLGVRMMNLCWNYQNQICSGVLADNDTGLTDFGCKVVEKMNDLGMIIDVSHMSEKSFWDTIERTTAPVVASHSNVYKIKNHPRNLKDSQIKAIIQSDGCIGINFYTDFLSDGKCDIVTVLKHIEHILTLGGENNVTFGSDFDGMESLPQNINSIADISKIIDEMLSLGYSDDLIQKISHRNFLRLAERVIK